jgi:glycosyltransferase involved in cell wall biosynthesis
MSKKVTITIGIPAFNEEANIGHLLHDILKQNLQGYVLKEIIVSSDGSTDNTIKILNSIKSSVLKIVDNKDRQGQSARQNQIIDMTDTEVLVLLNADILITDPDFITKLIQPIVNGTDLTSSALEILPGRNFIEKSLQVGLEAKNMVFERLRSGNNIYTCHGAARAFSKKLYKDFRFKDSVGEDAYSYLYAKSYGYTYSYVKDAIAYIRYADNFEDHKKQSLRFRQSQRQFKKEFGERLIKQEYAIPLNSYIMPGINIMITKPLLMLAYSSLFLRSFIESRFAPQISNTWSISKSSKTVR